MFGDKGLTCSVSQTGVVANSKAAVSVEKIVSVSSRISLVKQNQLYLNALVSPEGECRSAEEKSGQIWHERFIHFQKGAHELVWMLITFLVLF